MFDGHVVEVDVGVALVAHVGLHVAFLRGNALGRGQLVARAGGAAQLAGLTAH